MWAVILKRDENVSWREVGMSMTHKNVSVGIIVAILGSLGTVNRSNIAIFGDARLVRYYPVLNGNYRQFDKS